MIRYSSWNGWRTFMRISSQVQASSSSAPVAAGLHPSPCSEPTKVIEESVNEESSVDKSLTENSTLEEKISHDTIISKPIAKERRQSMVAAAFASLKDVDSTRTQPRSLDERITAADSVESLLINAEASQVSRRHALRIVSQLADWTTKGRVKLSEFETDARFMKLCRILSRVTPRNAQSVENNPVGFGDLSVVLGITGDDEAAKLVSGASLSQMIRIMSSLAQKQRRSTPLLRSLAFNISRQEEKLNVKHCADLLFAMSTLNFPDELLLEKTSLDLCECITANEKSAVIGSIFTSLGRLRYKNTEVLDALTSWVASHVDVCRPQDLTAMLMTLSSVFYVPENANKFFEVVLPHMTIQDAPSVTAWLDIVWSLVVLERATSQHVSSVLDPNFYNKLVVNTDENQKISIASKLKLLNINAAAQLTIPEYKGVLLPPDSDVRNVPLVRSRTKQLLLASIFDSLSNLLPSATYLRSNIDTGMGFLLDGECMLDSKCNPIPVPDTTPLSTNVHNEKKSSTSVHKKSISTSKTQKGIRIGILAWDYPDMCRGIPDPNGVSVLSMRLLEKAGYKILSVPYTEYNPQEKLVRRVQYLDRHLKSLVIGS